jgi:hypothetical protein
MADACDTYGGLGVKPLGKGPLGKYRHGFEDDVKMERKSDRRG